MAWKFYYFTHILKDESWTSINVMIDYGNVTIDYGKITEISLALKITDKICINYEILQTEIWNMSPEIFPKVEIWALIFLSFKFHRQFSIVTYP